MTTRKNWIPQSNGNFRCSDPSMLDSYHFIAYTESGVISFNIKTNKWKFIKMNAVINPELLFKTSICCDPALNQICIVNSKKLVIYDAEQEKVIASQNINIYRPRVVCINSQFHILAGYGSLNNEIISHFVWDDTLNKLQIIDEFGRYLRDWNAFGLISNQRAKQILILGGYFYTKNTIKSVSDVIHKYCLRDKRWKLADIKLPQKMNSFGCVVTRDGRYVIILGGYQ